MTQAVSPLNEVALSAIQHEFEATLPATPKVRQVGRETSVEYRRWVALASTPALKEKTLLASFALIAQSHGGPAVETSSTLPERTSDLYYEKFDVQPSYAWTETYEAAWYVDPVPASP